MLANKYWLHRAPTLDYVQEYTTILINMYMCDISHYASKVLGYSVTNGEQLFLEYLPHRIRYTQLNTMFEQHKDSFAVYLEEHRQVIAKNLLPFNARTALEILYTHEYLLYDLNLPIDLHNRIGGPIDKVKLVKTCPTLMYEQPAKMSTLPLAGILTCPFFLETSESCWTFDDKKYSLFDLFASVQQEGELRLLAIPEINTIKNYLKDVCTIYKCGEYANRYSKFLDRALILVENPYAPKPSIDIKTYLMGRKTVRDRAQAKPDLLWFDAILTSKFMSTDLTIDTQRNKELQLVRSLEKPV